MDGFERLILNGFKTEDIFLSHGCNKNNKKVECKNSLLERRKYNWSNNKVVLDEPKTRFYP